VRQLGEGTRVERILVAVDAPNLGGALKNLNPDRKIDCFKLRQVLLGDSPAEAEVRVYFLFWENHDPSVNFRVWLENNGFHSRVKRVHFEQDPEKRGRAADIDHLLMVDVAADMGRFDTLILVSGDGSYVDLVQQTVRRGKQVLIAAVPKVNLTFELTDAASRLIDLGDYEQWSIPKKEKEVPEIGGNGPQELGE
jgi:uncharacterized LabA/DUF88 family protein